MWLLDTETRTQIVFLCPCSAGLEVLVRQSLLNVPLISPCFNYLPHPSHLPVGSPLQCLIIISKILESGSLSIRNSSRKNTAVCSFCSLVTNPADLALLLYAQLSGQVPTRVPGQRVFSASLNSLLYCGAPSANESLVLDSRIAKILLEPFSNW